MHITVLCSDADHPVHAWLLRWRSAHAGRHDITLATRAGALPGGDALFLVSCHEIVGAAARGGYRKALVLHASDLPEGRGWSPHVWQVLEGRDRLVVTLLEAGDAPDSGPVWARREIALQGHELHEEINARVFEAELELMNFAIEQFDAVTPRPQGEAKDARRYRRRTPEDSRLDPDKTIAAQFDLLRVCDPDRYPAFFELRGHRYELRLRKSGGRQP